MTQFDWLFSTQKLETVETTADNLIHKRRPSIRKNFAALKREKLADAIVGLPAPGETWHVVSNGKYDFWSFAPVLIDRLGGYVKSFYGSTWTMSRPNALELIALYDAKKVGSIVLMTGTYFKRRESSVYATIVEALMSRGQTFLAFENHAKVMLLDNGTDALVLEGSANFTANPRLEQYVITNDRGLHDFHANWMSDMAQKAKR